MFLNLSTDHLDRHPTLRGLRAGQGAHLPQPDRRGLGGGERGRPAGDGALGALGRPAQVAFHPQRLAHRDPDRDEAYFAGDAAAGAPRPPRAAPSSAAAKCALPGAHLASDLLAAATAARLMGAAPEAIARAVRTFARRARTCWSGWRRCEGVAFFNDSKATNVEAARRSLEAFAGPVLAIIGGRFKGGDFADLRPALEAHGKAVLAIGEARHRVRDALSPVVPVFDCAQPGGGRRAGLGGGRAGRHRPAGAGLLLVRHVQGLRRARRRVQARGRTRWWSAASDRGWLRSSSSDISLFAVTAALLGLGLVMVWSASTALAQERHDNAYYFLIRQVHLGAVGPGGHGRGHAPRLSQAAPAGGRLLGRGRHHGRCSSLVLFAADGERDAPLDPAGRALVPAVRAGQARGRALPRLPPGAEARPRERVPAVALPGAAAARLVRVPRLHPARPRHAPPPSCWWAR